MISPHVGLISFVAIDKYLVHDDNISIRSLFFQYINKTQQLNSESNQLDSAIDAYQLMLDELQPINEESEPLLRLEHLIEAFYQHFLFSTPSKKQLLPEAKHFDVLRAANYRTANTIVLGIYFIDFARHLGIEADLVEANGQQIVRLELSENELVFFDASTGSSLDWNQVKSRLSNSEEQEQPFDINEHAVDDELIVENLIRSYKGILIARGQYSEALEYCELLLIDEPDNPYLRRDRGYLLEQLECQVQAIADYEYFIEQCPEDPVAKMIKAQLDESGQKTVVIH